MDEDKPWLRAPSWIKENGIRRFKVKLANARRYSEGELRKGIRSGSRIKVIVSGPIIERWEYDIPVKTGKRPRIFDVETGEVVNGGRTMEVEIDADGNVIRKPRKIDAKRTNARRSKMQLRRLVLSNFSDRDKFVTLTFRDGAVSDVTDVKSCNKAFELFIKRLRRRHGDFKFCRVIEFQDANGRGAVHYHCIMTLPYIPMTELADAWGAGYVGITAIDHVDNVGAYVQKYMAKDLDDNRLAGSKAFATSHNLVRPIVLHGRQAYEVSQQYCGEKKEVFASSYESEYQGNIRYTEYNTRRG